ncbi:MAG: hypothetical protein ABI759_08950 [Candidatus Solibacter sp.]
MATDPPYVSVVVAARNDNHGGNMLGRMQAFLDAWMVQAERYGLASEIVVVEWNPPPGSPRLNEALRWPQTALSCEVRFVEVAGEIHERFAHSDVIPLHQMIAKNAGIRRARGEFVLVTNLDIIFSPVMMQFLAARQLQQGVMYRLDRLDIASSLPEGGDVDELLRFCEGNVLRVFAREGGFPLDAEGWPLPIENDVFTRESGIRLGSGWHEIERSDFDCYRWTDPEAEFRFERPRGAAPRLVMDLEAGPSAGDEPVTLEIADLTDNVLAAATLRGRAIMRLHLPPELTSGRLRLRTKGRGLALIRDPRILHLRVLGMEWETAPEWMQATAMPPESKGRAEPEVRVVSTGERRIQFAVRPASGQSLRNFAVELKDAAGNTVLSAAQQTGDGDHLVTLHLDFELAGGAGDASPWLLETVREKKAYVWEGQFHAVNPRAAKMVKATYLHTHACGDFTLLARDDWFALRAYPEWPIWPMHLDALFCYSAYHAGIREEILHDPLRIYHIEHGTAAGWTPEGEKARAARLQAKGLSELQYPEVVRWINLMRRFNAPLIFTLSQWGLAAERLPETRV